jgi:lipopolysaccharide transport system ATP-binding protein
MTSRVIQIEGICKSYLVGHSTQQQGSYTALRDVIARGARDLARKTRDMIHGRPIIQGDEIEEFWALNEISFDVGLGETLGIIGKNGAGKSTLLKILSRITEPTKGRITIEGRVASLLEVGTGFHPELTGRENIFLNGAILGMSRSEILRKFDEIVSFAEVEKFLDTPVKRYSSGMYVRLAFAVAAHLQPEILVVDEVLAVGDVHFQQKCLGKMSSVAREGRTVIFVSHNMNAVEELCSRVISLKSGRVVNDTANVRQGIQDYLGGEHDPDSAQSCWINNGLQFDHPVMRPLYFALVDENDSPLQVSVRNDLQLTVVIRMLVKQVDPALSVGFVLYNNNAEVLLWSISTDAAEKDWPTIDVGEIELRCLLPKRLLNEGVYRLEINAGLHHREYICRPGYNTPSISFEIQGGLSDSPYWFNARPGLFAPEWKWQRAG